MAEQTFHAGHDCSLRLFEDDEGWSRAECGCGWLSPPCPDLETAADFWARHVKADQ